MSFDAAAAARPNLRRDKPADAEPIARLLAETFGGGEIAQLLAALQADGDLIMTVLAERDGRLVGCCSIARLEIRGARETTPGVALFGLGVAADWRGQGVAASLTRVALQQARKRNGAAVALARGSTRLLERLGFSRHFCLRVATAWPRDEMFGRALVDGVGALEGDAFFPRAFYGEGTQDAD